MSKRFYSETEPKNVVEPPKKKEKKQKTKKSSGFSFCFNETIIIEEPEKEIEYKDCNEDEVDEILKLFSKDNITIDDLIDWGYLYDLKQRRMCDTIDLKMLSNLQKPLMELKAMVGMENIKKTIVINIILSLQKLDKTDTMYHTVIYGPPGVGKTSVAKIIAHIYLAMSVIKGLRNGNIDVSDKYFDIDDYFVNAKRSDLIGKYLGQTAVQTQQVIDDCKMWGKILFIDEVYSLGNSEGRDSFSKECIDTINLNLTDGMGHFICIIAGYKNDIETCFFNYNKGLNRRFNFRYEINEYTNGELKEMFIRKIIESGWRIENEKDLNDKDFDKKTFPNFGGDIMTLIHKCKIAHSLRVFSKKNIHKKILTKGDFIEGLKIFNDSKPTNNDVINDYINGLYI